MGFIKVSANWSFNKNPSLSTVENVQNVLGAHEFLAHGILRFAIDPSKLHSGAYLFQMKHYSWPNTTGRLKSDMGDHYNHYIKIGD